MPLALPPTAVDLRPWAHSADGGDAGAALQGEMLLNDLPRVAADAPASVPQPLPLVRWEARAEWRQPVAADLGDVPKPFVGKAPPGFPPGQHLWLQLRVSTQVPLACQRCLQPYQQPVEVDRWFRFVLDEAQALQEDDDVPEDLLVWSPKFNLLELIEDEVLLDLPLIPKHEDCAHTWQPEPQPAVEAAAERPNPFAVLAQLKPGNPPKKGGA
jgi:uncharacterized protein